MLKNYVTWDEIKNHIIKSGVADKYKDIDLVISIGSGGMVPGVIIAKLITKPIVNIGARTYGVGSNDQFRTSVTEMYQHFKPKKSVKKILVVDDINDTGYTLHAVNNYLQQNNTKERIINFFTVFKKPYSIFDCDYAVEVPNDTWIVFPWEVNV